MSKTLEIAAESLYEELRKDMLPYTIWPDPKPRIIKKIIAALEEIRMSKDTESHTYPDGSKITITASQAQTVLEQRLKRAEARVQELQAAIDFILTVEMRFNPSECYTLPDGNCVAPRCKLHVGVSR
jgi:hypothetical protein